MNLDLHSIRPLAALAAGGAVFTLGGIWYTAFQKLWQRLHGYTDGQCAAMRSKMPPPVFLGSMLLSYLLLVGVMDMLIHAIGATTAASGACFGSCLWLGVALPIGITSWIASEKRLGACALDWAYQALFLPMAGAILGGW